MGPDPITQPQREYAEGIAKRLKLPVRMLDDFCVQRFGRPLAGLTKREGSALLDEVILWQAIPAEMKKALGQIELPGMG